MKYIKRWKQLHSINFKCFILGHQLPNLPLTKVDGLYCQRCLKELSKQKYQGKFKEDLKEKI
jgi:hypothetical protein